MTIYKVRWLISQKLELLIFLQPFFMPDQLCYQRPTFWSNAYNYLLSLPPTYPYSKNFENWSDQTPISPQSHYLHPQVLLIIRPDDRFETLLTCSIPYHSFDYSRTHLEQLGAELNAKSWLVILGEGVVDEAEKEGALADVWVRWGYLHRR